MFQPPNVPPVEAAVPDEIFADTPIRSSSEEQNSQEVLTQALPEDMAGKFNINLDVIIIRKLFVHISLFS